MYVHQGNDEQSALWEELYLKDDQIDLALSTKAVTLCIDADSQEAGYLSAYYPVPVVPALIVIQYVCDGLDQEMLSMVCRWCLIKG